MWTDFPPKHLKRLILVFYGGAVWELKPSYRICKKTKTLGLSALKLSINMYPYQKYTGLDHVFLYSWELNKYKKINKLLPLICCRMLFLQWGGFIRLSVVLQQEVGPCNRSGQRQGGLFLIIEPRIFSVAIHLPLPGLPGASGHPTPQASCWEGGRDNDTCRSLSRPRRYHWGLIDKLSLSGRMREWGLR